MCGSVQFIITFFSTTGRHIYIFRNCKIQKSVSSSMNPYEPPMLQHVQLYKCFFYYNVPYRLKSVICTIVKFLVSSKDFLQLKNSDKKK